MENRTLEEEYKILKHWEKVGFIEGYYNVKTRILDDGKEILEAYKTGYEEGSKRRGELHEEVIQNRATLIDYDKRRNTYLRIEGYYTGLGLRISTDAFLNDNDRTQYKKGIESAEELKSFEHETFDDFAERKRHKYTRKQK